MRILLLAHFIPYPPHGGAIQRTFNLLKEASKNNEIYLVTFSQNAIQPDSKKRIDNINELRKYCKEVTVIEIPSDSSKLHRLWILFACIFSRNPFDVWRFKSWEMARAIKEQLGRNRFDVFHAETLALAQYIYLFPEMGSVLIHHNVESTYILRRGRSEKNPFTRFYLYLQGMKTRAYEKKVAPMFGMNVAVSDLDMANFKARIPEANFTVITNGTDPSYFKPTCENEEQSLIFTGGLTWYPNRDAMIYFCSSVYPLIKLKMKNIRLDIIGRSPSPELQNFAAKDSSIILHGFVDDVRGYVAKAAVYVVPIRVGGGTRLKILDAFAAGKALVSTSIGCEGLEVSDGKNIQIADTDQEFADKVILLLEDAALRKELGKQARKLVETTYSWEILGHKLNNIYKDIGL